MTPEQLNEIEARANAATEGPWGVGNGDTIGLGVEQHSSGAGFAYGVIVAEVTADSDREIDVEASAEYGRRYEVAKPERDAEFIAHARQDVPAMLAEVKRLQETNSYLRDQLADERDRSADFVNKLCMLIPDERDDDVAVEAIVIDWVKELLADRDRAREIAVALEQQLAEIKRLTYMGGQNGEVVRGWIIGVLERANTLDPQGQQDIHVCSPQTCGAVYNQEEDE